MKYAIKGLLVHNYWNIRGDWKPLDGATLFGSMVEAVEQIKSGAPGGPLTIVGVNEIPQPKYTEVLL